MKKTAGLIILNQTDLNKALSKVIAASEKKTTKPSVNHVLVIPENGALNLICTDFEHSISVLVTAQIFGNIEKFAVHVSYFWEIVKRLDGQIQISPQGNEVIITSDRASFSLNVFDVAEHPGLIEFAPSHEMSLLDTKIKDILEKSSFAIAENSQRAALQGLYWHTHEDIFCSVSLDTFRIAWTKTSLPKELKNFKGVILSRRTVQELRRLLGNENLEVSIRIGESYISFSYQKVILVARLLKGEFPIYLGIIENAEGHLLTVNTLKLKKSLERVAVFAPENTNLISLTINGPILVISSNNRNYGHATESIDISYEGPSMKIFLNSKFINDVMNVIPSPFTHILLSTGLENNESSPVIFYHNNNKDNIYVVMPIKNGVI